MHENPKMIAMFDGKDWGEAVDPLAPDLEYDDAVSKAGYSIFRNMGPEWRSSINLYQHQTGNSFMACINTTDSWLMIYLPNLAAMMDFIRLYSPSWSLSDVIDDLSAEVSRLAVLLTEKEGPLFNAQQQQWRRQRLDAEKYKRQIDSVTNRTADKAPAAPAPPEAPPRSS